MPDPTPHEYRIYVKGWNHGLAMGIPIGFVVALILTKIASAYKVFG